MKEHIFDMDKRRFELELADIVPEVLEAYPEYDEDDRFISAYMWKLAGALFSYVKKHYTEEKCLTAVILEKLCFCVYTNEVLFLTGDNSLSIQRDYLLKCEQGLDECFHLGMVIEYYYRVYERFRRSEDNNKVDRAFANLKEAVSEQKRKRKEAKEAPKIEKEKSNLPLHIKSRLDEAIVGQTEAKKMLAVAISRFLAYGDRTPILLAGPTGCGKTFLFQTLCQIEELKSKLTFFYYSLTELTPNGFQGDDLETIFKMFKSSSEISKPGIIFLDEADKVLCYSNTASNNENVHAIIQHQLLTAIAGSQVFKDVDTSRILFILAGAFENLEDEVHNKTQKVGFVTADLVEEKEKPVFEIESTFRRKMVKAGACNQLISRIGRIVNMEPLGTNELKAILSKRLGKRAAEYAKYGKTLVVDEEVLNIFVDWMKESNMGARAADSLVGNLIDRHEYDFLMYYDILHIDKAVLEGKPPKFERIEENENSKRSFT